MEGHENEGMISEKFVPKTFTSGLTF